jgi:DNA replication protein DnaC
MSRRYERASTVMTSNKGFEEWGEVLGDEVMAAALIDRILHHCHIVNIRGNSYRMRQHTELWRTLRQDAEETTRSRRKAKEEKPA